MRERFEQIRDSNIMTMGHVIILGLYALTSLVSYNSGGGVTLITMLSIIAVSLVIIFLELQTGRGKFPHLKTGKIGIVYNLLRVALVCVSFCFVGDEFHREIAAVIILLFSVEAVLYVPFDETNNRIVTYLVLVAFYLCSFGLRFIKSNNYWATEFRKSLPPYISFQFFVLGVVLLASVILMGEVIAAMWNCFEKKIFAQDRAVEDLNELNNSLREHQEEIKKINEVLGRQKIDLQAANKKINRAHDEMSVQNEVASTITTSLGKEEMLENVVKIMSIRLDMDLVMVILEPDDSLLAPGELSQGRYVAISGDMGKEVEDAIVRSVKETKMDEILLLSQSYMKNTETETIKFFKYMDDENLLPSLICIPIVKQTERLGTLIAGKKKENAFMDGRSFYESIASQLSIGISNAKLYAQMNDMAIRDGLTRIYNRGHLQSLLNDFLSEAMAKKNPVTLALFDIDKFKLVNDNYGHQCGDEVIRYVAHLLNKGAIANGGIAGRYGGEEFVIAFLGKTVDETYRIVKQIHDEIRSRDVEYDNKSIHVTASAGIASYPETCTNPSELLTRADWAMYTSKKNGRDRITIDSDQIETMM